VPIHPSTNAVLADYLRRREQFFGRPISMFVFVGHSGNRLDGGTQATAKISVVLTIRALVDHCKNVHRTLAAADEARYWESQGNMVNV
jgi:hypothetical protein